MQKIKVLIVNDYLERGGIETLIFDFVSFCNIKDELVEVSLLLKETRGELINDLPSKTNLYIILRKKFFDIKYLLSLRKFLILHSFSIIHTHTPISGFYLFLAKIGLKIPMVQTIHGFWDKRSPSKKYQLIHLFLTYILMFFCKSNIMVSNYLKEQYTKTYLPKKKFSIIYNGINFEKFNNNQKSEIYFTEKIKLGMVGNFNYGRSHETLIEAFI